jgi:branched-chain amino acid transport system permease protein
MAERTTPDALRRLWPLAALLLLILAIVLLASLAPIVIQRRVVEALILLIAVVALYIFAGNSGVLSFGNVSFMAIGAYVSALLTMKPAAKAVFLPGLPVLLKAAEWGTVPAALAGGLVAATAGLIVGVPLMRLSGIAASIATFAVLSITYVVLGNWTSVTGGQNSLFGLPIYSDLWTVLPWTLVAIAAAFAYQETRSGLMLRASREDEVAAEAGGIDVHRQRLYAFVLSAFFSGIAGVLYGHFLGVLRVETFYLDMTFLVVAMLVIGGMRSLAGAVLGALVISTLTELLRLLEAGVPVGGVTVAAPAGLGDAILALAMLLIILFRPQGIAAGRELTWPFARRVRRQAAETDNVSEGETP